MNNTYNTQKYLYYSVCLDFLDFLDYSVCLDCFEKYIFSYLFVFFGSTLVDDGDSDPADDNESSVQDEIRDDTIHNKDILNAPPPPQAPPALQAPTPPLDILDFLH